MSAGRVRYPGFSPEAWDPFYPFPAIQAEASAGVGFEWRETVEAHVLTARMPGARKEEVKVEVKAGGMLKISGEKLLRLPENGRVAEITAAMGKDGVLTVTVPKVGAYYKVIPIA